MSDASSTAELPVSSTTPRFSVVVPTLQRNDSLARCLNRLMADRQNLASDQFEVIVADDGPEDDNARLLVTHTYPWARWVAGPKRGPAANRNRGAAQAQGEWLAFTDDDCLPQPGWLAAFVARLDGADGERLRVLEGRTFAGEGFGPMGPGFTSPDNEHGGLLWSCNFAIERRFFFELGGFDERFPFSHLEDVDLRLRLEDRREPYLFVPEAVVEHPPRPEASARSWARSRESAFYLARKRGVPLSAIHFGLYPFLRGHYDTFRMCRHAGDFFWAVRRIVAEAVLLAWYVPQWRAKYPVKG